MSYAAAVEDLFARGAELSGVRRKFELQHMVTLVERLGEPQSRFRSVLIAGTNGKGSTAATLASILVHSGYRTGLYTSPHLLRVNERVQTGGGDLGGMLREIDDETFERLYQRVDEAAKALVSEGGLPHPPSFFEVMTAIAFLAFADAGVEVAVLEVGLGGRLDATNVVDPLISVITDIALDHTEWLGETIGAIATEKAGILRKGGVLVTLPQHPEANAAIGERAMALDVTGVNAAAYLPQPSPRTVVEGSYLVPAFGGLLEVTPHLDGEHQRRNLALAIAAAEWMRERCGMEKITDRSVTAGVAGVQWPGRLEHAALPGGAALLMDVAHNPAGVWTLRSYLSRGFAATEESCQRLEGPRTLVFSALSDKAMEEMAQVLFPIFDGEGDRVVLVPVQNPRSATEERLREVAEQFATNGRVMGSVAAAFAEMGKLQTGTVVVAGSVYLVGEWKQAMVEASLREIEPAEATA